MSPEEEMRMLRAMLVQYGQQPPQEQSSLDAARAQQVPVGEYRQRWDVSPTPDTPRYRGDPYTTSPDGSVSAQDAVDNFYDRAALERILSGGRL